MTVLRHIWIALLLVALLPWGAYLHAPPAFADAGAPAVSAVTGQGTALSDGASESVEKPVLRCRKGLPGAPCVPDAKGFLPQGGQDLPVAPRCVALEEGGSLPSGTAARPALPPPRPV